MKKLLLPFVLICALARPGFTQEIKKDLKAFNRIIISPKINVVLEEGEQESVRLVYSNVAADNINIQVSHKTLNIYLDDTRYIPGRLHHHHFHKYERYADASITAYVTYKALKYLEIRGNQEVQCLSPIKSETFTLKAFGETDITMASLKTKYLNASLFGENKLEISGGEAYEQRYRLFGENKIDTQALKSHDTAMNIYGEGRSKVSASDQFRINAFGEPRVVLLGDAHISKRLVIGDVKIRRD